MKTLTLFAAFAGFVWCQNSVPPRPKITGVAHIALQVRDIEKARLFYKDFLGFSEPFKLDNPDGTLALTFIKVNDRQYIELFPERTPNSDRLLHIAIEVDNAEAMRQYLAAKGIRVPDKVSTTRTKNASFMVKDPDGHLVEVVQYLPGGMNRQTRGKFMNGPRISQRIAHLGIAVGSLQPAMKFYGEILGFQETWRGSRDGKVLDWVNMKVPDGEDYLEFMLYDQPPSLQRLGSMHHICLEVPDMNKAVAELEARPARRHYNRPLEIRTGVNRRRLVNLYDPDGTRCELMEPQTVDGVPPPSSQAKPPR